MYTDLSFRETADWGDLPYPGTTGGKINTLLLGDSKAGPLVALAYMPPMDEPLKRGTAHGHESDNWRITLLGESHMGPSTYGPGQFRFQTGGQPYGADDYAAGPEGGYHLVMFGDRRGFPIQPVKQELREVIGKQNEAAAAALGIEVPDPYPADERGLVTNLAEPDKAGKVESSFADAADWPELAPGVRAAAGLFGHREVGPLLLLLQCGPGTTALPAASHGTEVLFMVVAGSGRIGDVDYALGDLRLHDAGAPLPEVVAGPDGLSLYALFADRRGAAGEPLAGVVAQLTKDLLGTVSPA